MKFSTATLSYTGGRKINQDACGFLETPNGATCWIMADGLGGHGGGEVASELAKKEILRTFEQQPEVSLQAMQNGILNAQNAILSQQAASEPLKRMRTTLVVLAADSHKAQWAHIGDSRLYFFRRGVLTELTRDHSVPQALVDAGTIQQSEIRYHEDRNRILRSLGNLNDLRPTFRPEPILLEAGDAFLMVTDGFWEFVHELEMQADWAKSLTPQVWLDLMQERLLARASGEHDNYSAVAIFVEA